MSNAHLLIKAAALSTSVGQGIRTLKGIVPKAVGYGADALHAVGDVGQGLGNLAGVDPELARAAAQVAGIGAVGYGLKATKDQTQQKLDNIRFQLQGYPGYY